MSLGVIFKSPEGLVLAADSRATVQAIQQLPQPLTVPNPAGGTTTVTHQLLTAYYDNATKLLSVESQSHVGMVTYGAGSIGQLQPRTAYSYLPEFETHLLKGKGEGRLTVEEFAAEVGAFYLKEWTDAGMPPDPAAVGAQALFFLVAGFDEGEAYGKVFEVTVPTAVTPNELKAGTFGVVWGGVTEYLNRLINGTDPKAAEVAAQALGLNAAQVATLTQAWSDNLGMPIPYQFLSLQDCIDMADFLVSITSDIQTWMVAVRGVGGDIDVATITRIDGFKSVRQKRPHPWGE